MLRTHTESVHSFWLCTDAAGALFEAAKRRVYTVRQAEPPLSLGKRKDTEGEPGPNPKGDKAAVELDVVLEPMPKWSEVQRILAEIKSEVQGEKKQAGGGAETVDLTEEDDAPAAAASAGTPSTSTSTPTGTTTVLVAVKHQSTASQLEQVIRLGIDAVMNGIFERYVPLAQP